MPRLLYIGQSPAAGTGSPIVIRRHLQRLAAEGWTVDLIADRGASPDFDPGRGVIRVLPAGRRWWPPYREGSAEWLRRIRTTLLARECQSLLPAVPDAVLGYLAAHADFSAEVAARLAARLGRPLTLLVHDDATAFASDPAQQRRLRSRHRRILRAAQTCWFASPALAQRYGLDPGHARVLPPIPEGATRAPRAAPASPLRVYYAGHVWPAQLALLGRIARVLDAAGARLVVMAQRHAALDAFLASQPAEWRKPFAENAEALRHLAQSAAGLVISYADTVDAMPWSATSFPSKLVEYSHLAVPVAVVAPAETAVAAWARDTGFGGYFSPERVEIDFAAWTRSLCDAAGWRARAGELLGQAAGPFSADSIHARFAERLIP